MSPTTPTTNKHVCSSDAIVIPTSNNPCHELLSNSIVQAHHSNSEANLMTMEPCSSASHTPESNEPYASQCNIPVQKKLLTRMP